MTDIPNGPEQVGATGADSPRSKCLATLSFVLVVILCFEVDWLTDNIYRHAPWFDNIAPEDIDTVVEWIFGFFILSVVAAFASGKIMQVLQEPSRFLGKDRFNLLSHRLTVAGAGCFGVVVYLIIVFNPAVHLDYAAEGEKPMVIRNGNPLHFNDTTIVLPIDPPELRNQDIEITDRRGLYKIKLAPSDLSINTLVFSKHARIDLSKFFIKRDFNAELSGANNRDLGSFEFAYKSTDSLSEQCANSEPGFEKHFSDSTCAGFFRDIFRDISASPGRMLEDTEGSIFYDNRNYDYRYKFGPTIEISIIAPMAESVFGNRPLEAFDLYLNSSSNDRANLVDEFRKDIKVISPVRLGEVFESLASPERLSRKLNGTVALRQVSLSFVKDVLALGIDDLNQKTIRLLVEEISDTNLNTMVDRENIRLAIDTITALTRASYALDLLEAFVRDLGTDSNVLKPDMVRILLRHFDDKTGHDEAQQIVSIVGALWQSAQGTKTTTEGIRSEVSTCLDRLTDDHLKQILREFDKKSL